ncbi:hypothetical protein [uncultured Christiangramia sp.]|uniref:hypothetical protein n=1 Tax=Christiangramia sp. 3-2217-3z TaxID=3417564 RepID=UPI00262EC3D1|nr:hypothetical protein [uncultured Christiangramia sp.]
MNIKFSNRLIKIVLFTWTIIVSGCIEDKTIERKISTPTSEKIDSSKQLELSGVWNLNNKIYSKELFLFEDETWKRITVTDELDTIIEKGKYTVTNDSAVFFRHYGSQHWPNNDTINDYQTSLGAFVLFLTDDGDLNDNQEDYDETYVKVN